MQKPLAVCQGKTVPGAVRLVALERSVPGGPPRPPAAGFPGSVRRRAGGPEPWAAPQRCRVRAWFESEGRPLVHLVADAQREVVKGAADNSVGTVVQGLERRYVAVPPHEHCRCVGGRVAAVLCLVAVCLAALNVLENCCRKILGGISGESKIGEVK